MITLERENFGSLFRDCLQAGQMLGQHLAKRKFTEHLPRLEGRSVILVDDGLATGVTAAAAGRYLQKLKPKELILAVPVCPQDVDAMVRDQFHEIICLHSPENFSAVGLWYEDFSQVEDDEVMTILNKHHSV